MAPEEHGEAAPDAAPEQLEAKVDAIRDDLGGLVGELDRRRHRAAKPLAVGAVGIVVVGIGGYLLWRVMRSRPSTTSRLVHAVRRAMNNPERVAKQSPSLAKKVLAAAASAVATVFARRAAEDWSSTTARGKRAAYR